MMTGFWIKLALIAAGGAAGSLLRAGISEFVSARLWALAPFGTLAVNLLGCFLIGLARGAVEFHEWGSPAARLFVFTGFLGAFTTFSTFESDIMWLWDSGDRLWAGAYMVASVGGGLAAFLVGWSVISR